MSKNVYYLFTAEERHAIQCTHLNSPPCLTWLDTSPPQIKEATQAAGGNMVPRLSEA